MSDSAGLASSWSVTLTSLGNSSYCEVGPNGAPDQVRREILTCASAMCRDATTGSMQNASI